MSRRIIPLETGNIYHVLNRSIQDLPIFASTRQCEVFVELLKYYNNANPTYKFSLRDSIDQETPAARQVSIVETLNYCLMPTHFHLTLLQKSEHGISMFMHRVLDSFSHFYNKKYNNKGPLFQGNFRAIKVNTTEQLVHLSRYIHLNPVTSYIVKGPQDYKFSSYNIYLGKCTGDWINPNPILAEFKSVKFYERFVMSQTDYQRKLSKIKKILLEQAQKFKY